MAETRTALDVDDLLANSDWLRVLAARVLHDEAEVDDLVHEAWLAALRRPDQEFQDLPAWLATVVRNLSRRRLRQRSHLEAMPAGFEFTLEDASRGPAETYELEHVRRRVADAVLELPEPFRSTVLLNFFQGLPAEEIARRLGIPSATVRTRLRRALLRLRVKLEAGGGSDSICAGLVLLALPVPPPAPPVTPPQAPSASWPSAIGLSLAAAVLAMFSLTVWHAAGSADQGVMAHRGADAEQQLAETRQLAPQPEEAAGPEALTPLDEGQQHKGSVQDEYSQCGGGPLLGQGGNLATDAEAGTLPQPSLRGEPQGSKPTESGGSSLLALRQESNEPLVDSAHASLARAGSAAAFLGAGPRSAVDGAVRYSSHGPTHHRSFTWSARGLDVDDEEEDEEEEEGGRHDLTNGIPLEFLSVEGAPEAVSDFQALLPVPEDMSLEFLCSCRGHAFDGERRARAGEARSESDPEESQLCLLHPDGPWGPTAIPVLDTGEFVLLLGRGAALDSLSPLLPDRLVLVERPAAVQGQSSSPKR